MAASGSPWTIITTDYFKQKFKDVWRMSDFTAEGFDGTAIDIKGYVDTEIEFKGRLANIKLYVAEKGVNALGWRDQAKLGIILNPRACKPVLMIEESKDRDAIVLKFPQVFTDVLGKLKNYSHKIKLKSGARPVVQKLRNVPIGVRDELETILAGMVKDDVLEEIESSEWVSPIVLARKSDKPLRLCVDLRALNVNIIVNCHPLANINEVVSMLDGAKMFSALDLRSAYHQLELTEDFRHLTAFITPQGLFQFKCMPFGFASAASVFQRAMFILFHEMDTFLKCFQNDVLVYSKNVEEHKDHMLRVCEDFDEDCWNSGFVMSERKEVPREEDVVDGVDGEVRGTSDDNFGDGVGYENVENVRREDSIASRVKSEARTRYLSSKLKGFV
ncbi:hypothetical protein NDU88_001978 [Pleurodeles waltl]|uniref:ribonuclease H n=1 Tax=Pleurodeles waltl TaxID=8319 RepID=A0AAV7P713_PLEWA|nr:hypothetical protein NDU88_001978 [Pleurodeles waltl]